MINNYKAQRNVRAELSGAVDLGEPVSLFIAEDEVKVNTPNLVINGTFDEDANWTKGTGWTISGGTASCDGSQSSPTQLHQENLVNFADTYKHIWQIVFTVSGYSAGTVAPGMGGYDFESTVNANGTYKVVANPSDSDSNRRVYFHASSDFVGSIDNVKVYKVSDHTYKLMAVNDTIPATAVNTYAYGDMSDLIDGDTETALNDVLSSDNNTFDFEDGSDGFSLIVLNGFAKSGINGVTFLIASNLGRFKNGAANQGKAGLAFDTIIGRTYDVSFDIDAVNNAELQVSIGSSNLYNGDAAVTTSGVANNYNLATRFTADATTSYLYLQLTTSDSGDYVDIDDLKVREAFGYDYYNAPAYKFGIVSSMYDQDTGAMKSSGVAGDQVDVTIQGECIVRAIGSDTEYINRLISRISNTGFITGTTVDDASLPNAIGVVSDPDLPLTNENKVILFQGVDFSEHFVHKSSLQVHAKCDETITKFRPVSLFLDSAGDLLCRHDDIPAETPDADTDHTGVDPGKWGIAELGGASGDIIPITVAGKTHITTSGTKTAGHTIKRIQEDGTINSVTPGSVDKYTPNALATIMETTTGDIPITIFGGTPIGTITDWKRTIKITAKANGAITQYRPVSLYLDQYGNYKCISDDIPNSNTDNANGIWVDFRKWGIAQETVADGENVEIIVQGRTNVEDVDSTSPARGGYVLKITATGAVTATPSSGYQLSMLGIVEKVAKTSDGTPGVIIIF